MTESEGKNDKNLNREVVRHWADFSEAIGISDEHAQDELKQAENRVILEELLSGLPDRKRKILELRFFYEMTLREVGKELSVTPERVRVLQNEALQEIRGDIRISEMLNKPAS